MFWELEKSTKSDKGRPPDRTSHVSINASVFVSWPRSVINAISQPSRCMYERWGVDIASRLQELLTLHNTWGACLTSKMLDLFELCRLNMNISLMTSRGTRRMGAIFALALFKAFNLCLCRILSRSISIASHEVEGFRKSAESSRISLDSIWESSDSICEILKRARRTSSTPFSRIKWRARTVPIYQTQEATREHL